MKILVTGGGGQLGREWSDRLNTQKISFRSFNSSELDITNKGKVHEILDNYKPDVIVNCAAYTKVDQAEDEPGRALAINEMAVRELAQQSAARGIKLVHYSTDYVFPGKAQDRMAFPEGYPEDHEASPINQYGYSKLLGEQAITESGCDHLIIRVSWLCGKYGQNFVKTMLRLAKDRDELNVVDDQFGSPTFTENVVDNTLTLIRNSESGTFHLTSKGICSWYDFATEIFRSKHMNIRVNRVDSSTFKTRAPRPAYSKLNTQKISTIPGIQLMDWKKGTQRLLNEI